MTVEVKDIPASQVVPGDMVWNARLDRFEPCSPIPYPGGVRIVSRWSSYWHVPTGGTVSVLREGE